MLAHPLRSKTPAVRNLRFIGGTVPRMIMILDGILNGEAGFLYYWRIALGHLWLFGSAIWMKQLMHGG